MSNKIEISHRTIVFTISFLIFLYFLFQIRQVLLIFFVALVLMMALNPTVMRLEKLKIPRVLAIVIVYLLILAVFGIVIAGVIPPLVDQTTILISRFPEYIQGLGIPSINQDLVVSQFSQLGSLPSNLLKITVGVFSNLFNLVVLAVMTFYLLIEKKNLNRYLLFLFGSDGEKKAEKFINELEKKLGGWVRAEVTLMLIIGLMSYFGLRLLGIDYALPLALLAGLLEVVPNVGPTISAIPAVLAGLVISPLMGLAVTALYFLIQQVENTFIVPQVMSRETGVNPLMGLLSLIIGFKLAGVVGLILAIPVVLVVQVVYSEILTFKFSRQS